VSPTSPPARGEIRSLPAPGRTLGIDGEPVVDAAGVRGLKVSKAHPGTAAEKAGLHAGDVIHSVNGYLTTQGGNLAWIIANAAPDNVLKMSVRTASDGQVHTITAQLR
jgi:S1-C subfamily serine protease